MVFPLLNGESDSTGTLPKIRRTTGRAQAGAFCNDVPFR